MSEYHTFTARDDGLCETCGLQRLAVSHLRWEAAAYDHGFRRSYTAQRFVTPEEAEAFADKQPAGRVTSYTGRNIEDVTWYVRDLGAVATHNQAA